MILKVQNIRKSFRQGGTTIEVLRGLDLHAQEGETLAIVGESGSGKSTLLSLLAGLDRPDSGEISVAGTAFGSLDEKEMTRFRGAQMGIVFQQFHLMSTLNALENVSLPLEIAREPQAVEKAREALKSVGLSHRENHLPHQLSGGECQRVAIARAFVSNPRILLADEPSGSLDTRTGGSVMQQLFDLVASTKMTMILVTHNDSLANRCHRRVELVDGQFR